MVEQRALIICFKNSENARRIQLVWVSGKAAITSSIMLSLLPELPEWFKVLKFMMVINVKSGHICQKIPAEKAPRKKQSP